jgi:hypothetical protein
MHPTNANIPREEPPYQTVHAHASSHRIGVGIAVRDYNEGSFPFSVEALNFNDNRRQVCVELWRKGT